jgi:hypothetical protein
MCRSTACDVAGLAPSPLVVSDSPHLILITSSPRVTGSRVISLASCIICAARREAISSTRRSPCRSIANPATGLPAAPIPLAISSVQFGSIPITTAAATFGFAPVPISVWKKRSRSAPNCSRP